MGFSQLHKRVVYLISGLGLFALGLGGELPFPVVLLCAATYVASWWCEPPRILDPRWAQGWTLGLLALIALEIGRAWLGEPPLALALEVSAALQISRLSNRRAAAEHQQIILLAFLHLCASTVLSTEVTWAVPFVGFVLVVPWALSLTHLRGEIEAHFRADGDPAREGALARVLASRRVVGVRFLLGIAALSLPIFVITALLFLLFPRVGFGFLAFGRGGEGTLVGYDDEIELGAVGTLRTDTTVVMRVTPPASDRAPPALGSLRLRGTSFDHYDGRRWSRDLPPGSRGLRQIGNTWLVTRNRGEDDQLWDVVLDHFDPTVLFLLPGTVALELPPRVRAGIETERAIGISSGLDIRYDDDEGIGLHYGLWVAADPASELAPGLTTGERAAYLEVPPGHEGLADLARRWTEGASTDRERAERIAAHLRGPEFHYSLTMRDPGDEAPLVAFLLGHRTGHCEYFASSMVILMRTLGIPARNVNGFLGGRWNAFGEYYAIQAGDAHAWTEVFIEGAGWTTFDPTPSARSEAITEGGVLSDVLALFDALEAAWQEAVVEWDLGQQRSLFRRLARFARFGSWGSTNRADPAAPAPDESADSFALEWASGIAALALLGAAIWLERRRRRRSGPKDDLPREVRDLLSVFARLESVLAARGRPRPRQVTPREHARALEREGFAGAADVRAVTERYVEVRFGGGSITPAEIAALRARVQSIASARADGPRAPGAPPG